MSDTEPSQSRVRHHDTPSPNKGFEDTPISSKTLLGERTWVTIEHLGTLYRLQATRQGKLILTK
jgi:hemin uptake protein HemP